MALFKKDEEKKIVTRPVNEKPDLAGRNKHVRQLYSDSRQALWGDEFRTSGFLVPDQADLGRQYLLAQKNGAKWDLFRVREIEETQEDGWVNREKISGGPYGFFDAIDYLAAFESTAERQGLVLADIDEKQALGFAHYEAFGMREGLVFDVHDGLPHETRDGKIVTPGDFKKSDFVRVAQNHEEGKVRLRRMFEEAGRDATLASLMPPGQEINISLSSVFDIVESKEKINRLAAILDKACSIWQQALGKGFQFTAGEVTKYQLLPGIVLNEQTGEYEGKRKAYKDKATAAEVIVGLLDEAKLYYQSEFADVKGMENVLSGINGCVLAFETVRLQDEFYRVSHAAVIGEGAIDKVKSMTAETRSSLQKNGVSEADLVRFDAAVAQGLFDPPSEIPQAVIDFVNSLHKLEQKLMQEARALARPQTPAPNP